MAASLSAPPSAVTALARLANFDFLDFQLHNNNIDDDDDDDDDSNDSNIDTNCYSFDRDKERPSVACL